MEIGDNKSLVTNEKNSTEILGSIEAKFASHNLLRSHNTLAKYIPWIERMYESGLEKELKYKKLGKLY